MTYATQRARDVNFGDRTLVKGADRKQLADISVRDAQAFTVYAVARIEPSTARVYPLIALEWGHGGASVVSRELRVFRRFRAPVVASTVKVAGRLVDETGKAPPNSVSCHFAAFIAPGTDGETLRNTDWIAQHGAEGLVSDGPEQVLTVEGYPAAPATRWVMFFDATKRPPNGTFPHLCVPARRAFRRNRFDSHGFRFGVYWAASSTPILFTFDPTADLRVDVEVLT